MIKYPIKVNILGTEYTIEKRSYTEDPELEGLSGYCMYLKPLIVIGDAHTVEAFAGQQEEYLFEREKETLRHEILHAFLAESGLGVNTVGSAAWSQNEEMIDWFAIQLPKIVSVYNQVGCL